MVAVPTANAVTFPLLETLATLEALEDQLTLLFVASDGETVALSCFVSPTFKDAMKQETLGKVL